ncbi:MAG: hypothetical protein K9N55_09160 [Phycisphaerae bacterium]|nr:hypothetical protein [Phycisphaerae bacterium]
MENIEKTIINTALVFGLLCACVVSGCRARRDRFLTQSLEKELRSSQEIERELAALVEAIGQSREKEEDLLAMLGDRLDQSDVLVHVLESINVVIDMTLQNVKNAQTYGYKKARAILDGERITEIYRIFTPGELHHTGAPLDLAIPGPGFFMLDMPDGSTAYTRHGHFCRGPGGEITSSFGYLLEDSPILPKDPFEIIIGKNGSMNVMNLGTGNITTVSHLRLAVFQNPGGLHASSNTLFEETEASGQPILCGAGEDGAGSIQAGFLEESNVNLMEEMHALHILQTWRNGIERAILAINERKEN